MLIENDINYPFISLSKLSHFFINKIIVEARPNNLFLLGFDCFQLLIVFVGDFYVSFPSDYENMKMKTVEWFFRPLPSIFIPTCFHYYN
jgi:hypothetical protein